VEAAPNVEIYAMADLFRDRLETSVEQLRTHLPDGAFNAPQTRRFVGFDAYEGVLETDVDYVILATPPHYRPRQLRAAVETDTHVFFEKPVAVDPPGAKHVLETGRIAEEKGLSLVTGTIYRRQDNFVRGVRKIHNGAIGDLLAGQAFYLTGPVWQRPHEPGMSAMEWQCRNWYHFTWLSGDHIVEQFVHNLDTINWVMQGPPVKAEAVGGRQTRVDPSYGHIYDHFSVVYTYPNDVQVRAMCRQMERAAPNVSNRIEGTEGQAALNPGETVITDTDGDTVFEMEHGDANPYVTEHTDLVHSIRQEAPINEAEQIAHSTLTGILGREAAYTGQTITWDELMQADGLDLGPDTYDFGPASIPPVARPGTTTLDRTW
jgi:predicted dehydrogenase